MCQLPTKTSIASNLPDEAVKQTSEVFKDDKFKRTKKKGAYPYDYMNSVTKFDEKLLEKISTATFKMNIYLMKYKHSQSAWNTFNLNTMQYIVLMNVNDGRTR